MGIGSHKIKGHRNGFQEEIRKAAKESPDVFFNWFDESGGDVDTNFIKGQCEFSLYILMPVLYHLKELSQKTALEIGYGGGRLLAAAARSFGTVIGIDIHDQAEIVKAELCRRGIDNVTLLKSNGESIPVDDASIDFVYSFIVLQHVEKISIFNNYIAETARVLRSGGVAVLFFCRPYTFSADTSSRSLFALDTLLERLDPRGYREIMAKVNCNNLKVSLQYGARQAQKQGLAILGSGISRRLPDYSRYGRQHFLALKKN
jgi:SAM-dependent methyltransferase